MTTKLIVAVDQGEAIGNADGSLPWKIKADMARFKTLTTDGVVIMGYATFKSLKRVNGLPNRDNIVLSRRPEVDVRQELGSSTVITSPNLEKLLKNYYGTEADAWIIGGAQIYTQALELKLVDEIFLTQVHASSYAAVRLPFPLYAWKLFVLHQRKIGVNWEVVESENPGAAEGEPSITFVKLVRTP